MHKIQTSAKNTEKIEIQKFTRIDAQHFDKILSVDEKIKVCRKKWENPGKNSYFLPEQDYSSSMKMRYEKRNF